MSRKQEIAATQSDFERELADCNIKWHMVWTMECDLHWCSHKESFTDYQQARRARHLHMLVHNRVPRW